jgi:dihydrofolate synthase/folylpolyglutamate synthase
VIATSFAPQDRVSARLAQIGQEFGHGHALELTRIEAALEALGRPQDRLPPVIHVAGTNGKGSTCAYLRSITEAAGLKAHVFTSPHLIRPNERVRVAGKLASDEQFLAALDRVAAANVEITYFEAITAAAFLMFAETPADILALETGLGGRVDATNIFAKPAVTIITPIDLDHAHLLGDTLAKIAAEKAGILKAGTPAVFARQQVEAMDVIRARAGTVGAPLFVCGEEWDCWAHAGRMAVQTENRFLDLASPGLIGPHQIDNAGLAVRAALLLNRFDEAALSDGVAHVSWPGRLQALKRGPLAAPVLAAGGELWLDGGHNTHAGRALAVSLAAMNARSPRETVVIAGMLGTKDAGGFLTALASQTRRLIAVPVHGSRVARTPEELAGEARAAGLEATAVQSLPEAIALAPPGARVLICGSLYLAGEALALSGIELT